MLDPTTAASSSAVPADTPAEAAARLDGYARGIRDERARIRRELLAVAANWRADRLIALADLICPEATSTTARESGLTQGGSMPEQTPETTLDPNAELAEQEAAGEQQTESVPPAETHGDCA